MNMKADHNREEKTLNSLDGMQRAPMSPLLYERIVKSIDAAEAKIVSLPPLQRWSIAAGIVLLVILNVYSLRKNTAAAGKASSSPFAQEYFSYLDNQF
jgi:hypothetical protein